MNEINVLVKKPGHEWQRKTIANELKALQEIVGGYIEVVTITPGLAVICDEEGRLKGQRHNTNVGGIDFVGTIILAGVFGEEFINVPFAPKAMTACTGV